MSSCIRCIHFCLFLLLIVEVLLRIAIPLPEVLNFNRLHYSKLFQDESHAGSTDPYRLSRASFSWSSAPDGVEVIHHLNLYGFRDLEWSVSKEEGYKRIAFLGDSMVEGFMVEDWQSIPAVFRSIVETRDLNAEVFNLGVGAAGLEEYMRLARDFVPTFRPDYLVLVLYANDFRRPKQEYDSSLWQRAIEPHYRSFLDFRVTLLVSALSSGSAVPLLWGQPTFSFLEPVPSKSNPWSNNERRREYLDYVDPEIAEAMINGRFNPYVVNRANKLQKTFLDPQDIAKQLADIKNYVEKYKTSLVVVYVPNMLQVSDYYLPFQDKLVKTKLTSSRGADYHRQSRMLAEDCSALRINCLDLTSDIEAQEQEGNHLYWEYDSHMNKKGLRLVAERIFECLAKDVW